MKVKLLAPPSSTTTTTADQGGVEDEHYNSGPRFIFDSGGYHGGKGVTMFVEKEELHCVVAITNSVWTVSVWNISFL